MDSSGPSNNERVLYLQQIAIEVATKTKFRVNLLIDDDEIDLQRLNDKALIWSPSRSLEVPPTSKVSIIIKVGHRIGGLSFGRMEAKTQIGGDEIAQAFWDSTEAISSLTRQIMFNDQSATLILNLRPSPTSESIHATLRTLQVEMKNFKPLMANWAEQHGNTVAKYAIALSELNPIAKAAVGVVNASFEILKEQQRYDAMVSDLADKVERFFPFVKRVEKEALYSDTELMETIIKRMYDLVLDTAEFICSYVRQNALRRATKFIVSTKEREKITQLDKDLGTLTEDFRHAISVETFITVRDSKFMDEDRFLRDRLEPVKAGYDAERGCMPETRRDLLDGIIDWALQPIDPNTLKNQTKLFWLYGTPGIGKTSVANSLCARLHEQKQLGGSFFCRRDDPHLAEPKYVLPRFIFELAEMWRPYRDLVIRELKEDPKLSATFAGPTLFLRIPEGLQKSPPHALVLVIDALDECGESKTRAPILKMLVEALSRLSWLKIIITSRPEQDITTFFQSVNDGGLCLSQDLGIDRQANMDIELFARRQFDLVATRCHLSDWPKEEDISKIVTRAGGLFIYVETVRRLVEREDDPEEALVEVIHRASGDREGALYQLYSNTIESKVGKKKELFRRAIQVIISVASHRPLSDEAVATLAGLKIAMMKTLADDLNSLLYRDNNSNGALRVRHLSIIDFLTDPNCPSEFRVDLAQANEKVAIACLTTMNHGLKFNICELETSILSNKDVKGLAQRVKEKIADTLQYSCIHWSSHICSSSYSANPELVAKLKEFFVGARPLFWIEVLSVTGEVALGVQALRQLLSWAKTSKDQYIELLKDALRFLITFNTPITMSAPHIYLSALAFTPVESEMWKTASASFKSNLMKVLRGRMKLWPSRQATWIGHTALVQSVAYSPDGRYVVSGSWDKTIRMWDVETGQTIGEPWEGHTESVWSVAYSPDGCHVVSGSWDNTIRMWDAQTGQKVGEPWRGHTGGVKTIAYSPDGRYLVSGSWDKTIRMWDVETGQAVGEPWSGHNDSVNSIAYSPNGRYVVSSSHDQTIRRWDLETGQAVGEPWSGHNASVYSVVYSPNGRYVVSGSWDNTIRMWDVETGQAIGEPWRGHTNRAISVAYSPDGRYIVSSSHDNTIRMWDTETGQAIGEPWRGHTGPVWSVAYSSDGCHVVSGSEDNTIRMWDAKTGQVAGEPRTGHAGSVSSVAYSPNGHYVVSDSYDNTIRIWDAENGQAIGEPWRGHTDKVTSVAYSPDGRYIVSGSWDKTIRIWDVETGQTIGEPWEGHTEFVWSVAYSPDGRHVVSGSNDETIRMWDAETGHTGGEPWSGHTDRVTSVAYSPDGRYVVSGSSDKTIQMWDVETGQAIGEPWRSALGGIYVPSVQSVAYSPDGDYVVSGSGDNMVRIWDAKTGQVVGESGSRQSSSVNTVAYSPDGRYIVSGSYDHTIRMWDAKTGKAIGEPWIGHTRSVNSVKYSPSGHHVVSGSDDNTIRIWDADTGEPWVGHENQLNSITSSIDGVHVVSGSNGTYSRNSHHKLTLFPVELHSFLLSSNVDYLPDSMGWVHHPEGGLLYWVPEDSRNGLICPAILTIPTNGCQRIVRLDFTNFRYGTAWSDIYEPKE